MGKAGKTTEFFGIGKYYSDRSINNVVAKFFKSEKKEEFEKRFEFERKEVSGSNFSNLNGQKLARAVKEYNEGHEEISMPQKYFDIYTIFTFPNIDYANKTKEEVLKSLEEMYLNDNNIKANIELSDSTSETIFVAAYTNRGEDIRHFLMRLAIKTNGEIKAWITKPKSENLRYEGDFFASRGHRVAHFSTSKAEGSDFMFIMIPKSNINTTQEFLYGTISYIDIDGNGICSNIVFLKIEETEIADITTNQGLYDLEKVKDNREIIEDFIFSKFVKTKYDSRVPEKLEAVREEIVKRNHKITLVQKSSKMGMNVDEITELTSLSKLQVQEMLALETRSGN